MKAATCSHIGYYLKRKGVSLTEAAEAVGMTKQELSAYNTGKVQPRVGVAIKLAHYLGVHVDVLWTLKEK